MAVANDRMSVLQRETFDRVWASKKFGTAIAAKMAMIATTISSSISVNARTLDTQLTSFRSCESKKMQTCLLFMLALHLLCEVGHRPLRKAPTSFCATIRPKPSTKSKSI